MKFKEIFTYKNIIVTIILGLVIFLVVRIVLDLNENKLLKYQEYLYVGYEQGWRNCMNAFEAKIEEIPNRVVTESYTSRLILFDMYCKKYYNISVLPLWQIDKDKIDNLTNKILINMTEKINEIKNKNPSWPIDSKEYTSTWGDRENPFKRNIGAINKLTFHSGIDVGAIIKTPVKAFEDGIVKKTSLSYQGYGKYILISHTNGLETAYGHLYRILVKQGDEVKKGQIIALSGNTGSTTGPHLHFETILDGISVNPLRFFEFY